MNILFTILVGTLGWQVAKKLKLFAPAILGSMLAVGITNILFDYATLPVSIKVLTQAISGAFIGIQIHKKDVLNFKYLVKPFLFLALLLTVNTFVVGLAIHYLCQVDLVTALLSCVAGGVSDISLIAIEMNANAGVVALMQTSRLIGVLLFFPYWIQFLTKNEANSEVDERLNQQVAQKETWLDRLLKTRNQKIIFTLLICFLFGMIGNWIKFPAASMVLPMAVIIGLNCTTSVCVVPVQIKDIAQLFAGSLVGVSIKASTFTNLATTIIPIILLLISYWTINFVFSQLCKRWKWLDLKSAMFASAPGGATDMSLIAAELNADLTKIGLIQVLRAAYVVAVMPTLILLFEKIWIF